MSTQNVERELSAVLHRHAEDAMDSTDTHTERERLFDVLDAEPGRTSRGRLLGVAAAAVVGVASIGAWSALTGEHETSPSQAPTSPSGQVEGEAVLLAERAVGAFAEHDGDAVAAMLTSKSAWPGLMIETQRNRAWNVEYVVDGCKAESVTSIGIVVECRADMNLFGSEEVGAGPFRGNVFSLFVTDGRVALGEVTHPFESNGMGDYLDEVYAWVEANHPQDFPFLDQDESEVAQDDRQRWLRKWESVAADYAEAMAEGSGSGS